MNKQEALQKIEELKQFVEKCNKEDERIYVPDHIEFELNSDRDKADTLWFDDSLAIRLNCEGNVIVCSRAKDYKAEPKQLHLVKVDKPEVGKWYCVSNHNIRDASTIKDLYYLILDNGSAYYIEGNTDVIKTNNYYVDEYYEVRLVNEE